MKAKTLTADTIQHLEKQVNTFLEENPGIEIQFVAQSESDASAHGWSITFTILYKKIGS
jgi:hypothetical protein